MLIVWSIEDNKWGGNRLDPKKSRWKIFQRIFALGIFWGEVSRYAATPLIVAFSWGHSDITRFRPWTPITTGNHLDRAKKIQSCPDNWHFWRFRSPFRHFWTNFAESFRIYRSSRMMEPTRPREMPSCSPIDLAVIRRSSKISSWIWSIITGVVTVLGRPGRGASQVEKSPCLICATQFLMVAYDGACSSNVSVRMAWFSFSTLPCRKKTWWQLDSPCCWNRARHLTCFFSASVIRKDLQFGTWTYPLSKDTIDYVLRHRELCRAGLISTPS